MRTSEDAGITDNKIVSIHTNDRSPRMFGSYYVQNMKTFISAFVSQSTNVIRKIVESMLLAIISIAFGIVGYVCGGANKSGPEFLVTQKHGKRKEMIFVPLLITVAAKTFNHLFACLGPEGYGNCAPTLNESEKISVLLDCPNASWEEFGAVDYDNLCTNSITADKDNLEFHQNSKNITEADLNDENEINSAPSSSEMKSIMKSVRSYLDSYSNCEMNNKMDDIEQLETI
ncbi:hypothetical protein TNCV_1073411 [Trichonephila clavipes]|nr:hypothetical protein TNCV_1073411 [Trichonephila clavipes]